ncbi:barstar family protein [Oceanicaulis sp. MMSF_3324]|uniref:barstar family protein n=1 Tax=Oceanicaulis sp. MMSF_3324 TaxID=3046702 RepID=UPI00273E4F95|nr:barstar family protein [Oceanicaulis sp. MMSF_3324]
MAQHYPTIRFASNELRDWASFHEACAKKFGFPDYYGRNRDAWIDCMRGDELAPGNPADDASIDILLVEFPNTHGVSGEMKDVCEFLYSGFASVNDYRRKVGCRPLFVLVDSPEYGGQDARV